MAEKNSQWMWRQNFPIREKKEKDGRKTHRPSDL